MSAGLVLIPPLCCPNGVLYVVVAAVVTIVVPDQVVSSPVSVVVDCDATEVVSSKVVDGTNWVVCGDVIAVADSAVVAEVLHLYSQLNVEFGITQSPTSISNTKALHV